MDPNWSSEKRDSPPQQATLNEPTKEALSELGLIHTWAQFVDTCNEQAKRRAKGLRW